jgi:hypothetical protein
VSHFTTVETKINDLVALKEALTELGLAFDEATQQQLVKVRGWRGATQEADISIHLKGYDIGVQQTADGNYKLVADWWAIEEETNQKAEEFQKVLVKTYAKHKVKREVAAQGFTLEEEQVEADGTVRLVVGKMGY